MEKPQQAEAIKLSIVNPYDSAVNYTELQQGFDSADNIAARLPSVLQTTLELNEVINIFDNEMRKAVSYDSFHYHHQGAQCNISTGHRKHHSCHYRLEMNTIWLGELTLTSRKKFSNEDIRVIEDLLCKLIYPLRNCLLYRQSQAAALEDKLTGLNNRGAFDTHLKREIDIAQRQHTAMSLIVLDIDHFKAVNDSHGHSGGDMALQALSKTITDTMRGSDIAFRFGGEEFTLILSNTDLEAAHLVAERIRIAVSQLSCKDGRRTFGFTVSLGVAQFNRDENSAELFDRADKALYQAKESGRNQTVCAALSISKDN